MSITSVASTISKYSNWAMCKLVNKLPNMTVSNERALKGIKWVGEHISSPQNRLILGASALMSQPFIDLHNKRVDEETRKTSASRTIAKILAGTTSGFLVRYYAIKVMDKMTKMPAKNRKCWETLLTPSPKYVKITAKTLAHYKKTVGTLLALGVMLWTNFLFDAPVTKMLTNRFIDLNKRMENKKQTNKISELENSSFTQSKVSYHQSSTNLIDLAIKRMTSLQNNGKEVIDV